MITFQSSEELKYYLNYRKEYGGEAGSLESIINSWEKRIVSYRDYYKEEERYGVDELKRIVKKPEANDLALNGSFRQLNVD